MEDEIDFPVPALNTGRDYEDDLRNYKSWGFDDAGWHFAKRSRVFAAMWKVTSRLESLGIAYLVIGSMATFFHGYRRFTEDVDIIVRPADIERIHNELVGDGYRLARPGRRNVRDEQFGVRIELEIAGTYPGDRQPKPVTFPDPSEAGVVFDGVKVVDLKTIIDLKLAAGIDCLVRMRDLADVQDLIKHAYLPLDLAESLHPYVRDKYIEHWHYAQSDRLYHDLARMPE